MGLSGFNNQILEFILCVKSLNSGKEKNCH